MAKVRTNIEIEDDYVQTIMHRYHLLTKTDVVDLAWVQVVIPTSSLTWGEGS